ncbi:hypothetical protein [Streptomyces carpinensis]|uniref:Uncharacterized protein n=1 Tax=Streptomyces carpinensis TaxID=66369 RepID=A0ABV1W514_9ACTN|nr:hypothetical protein [Streptomyces carpinensis]
MKLKDRPDALSKSLPGSAGADNMLSVYNSMATSLVKVAAHGGASAVKRDPA